MSLCSWTPCFSRPVPFIMLWRLAASTGILSSPIEKQSACSVILHSSKQYPKQYKFQQVFFWQRIISRSGLAFKCPKLPVIHINCELTWERLQPGQLHCANLWNNYMYKTLVRTALGQSTMGSPCNHLVSSFFKLIYEMWEWLLKPAFVSCP